MEVIFPKKYNKNTKYLQKNLCLLLGLPAPEASDNPLGYKFSWSPRGALMNMLSGGKKFCLNKKAKHQETFRLRNVFCQTISCR